MLNSLFSSWTCYPGAGKRVLRILVAGLMLFHGIAKARHGIDWIAADLASQGIPVFVT